MKRATTIHGENYYDRIKRRSKVDKKTGCWNYLYNKRHGYGFLSYKGKNKSAHRIMLIELTGLHADNPLMFACHKCHNRACVNPKHIYWGTRSDNTKDMFKDGTHFWLRRDQAGEKHFNSKITNSDAIIARKLKQDGLKMGEILKFFKNKYKQTTLNNIIYKTSKRFKDCWPKKE